jgi:hypothetical protein
MDPEPDDHGEPERDRETECEWGDRRWQNRGDWDRDSEGDKWPSPRDSVVKDQPARGGAYDADPDGNPQEQDPPPHTREGNKAAEAEAEYDTAGNR